MHLRQARNGRLSRLFFGLQAMALGTAIIVSSLALAALDAGENAPLVNRTAEAIAGYQDITPPDAGRVLRR